MYEGLVSGQVTTFGDSDQEESNDALAILDRIESADGEILYQPTPERKRVIDPKVSMAIGSVLENVVKFGTGREADKLVRLSEDDQGAGAEIAALNLSVPLLGKTGTANNYNNAAFLGYLPEVTENGVAMTARDGYAIGVYVGFDDNQPMRRNSSRISGAAGALPTWIEIANVLLQEQKYAGRLDPVDVSFGGLAIKWDDLGQMNVGVALDEGGKVIEPVVQVGDMQRSQPSILTFGRKSETGRFMAERNFQPYWRTAAEFRE
jgi:membrane peptidoglycan carboxypeptidase